MLLHYCIRVVFVLYSLSTCVINLRYDCKAIRKLQLSTNSMISICNESTSVFHCTPRYSFCSILNPAEELWSTRVLYRCATEFLPILCTKTCQTHGLYIEQQN